MGRLISQHGSPAAGSQLPTPAGWQQHAQQIPQQHYRQQRQPALPQRQQLHAHDATPPPVTFVPASPADVDACLAIQHATYPAALWEERAVVASILSHACSFLALEGGPPVGRLAQHTLARLAPHAASVSCVALPDAVGFWRRLGFVPPRVAPRAAAEAALSTYPAGSQLLLLAADHGDGGPA
ncbi:GNAT family [Micractinium conductrix]|uniref:GNAT family n=1 Tax=Micractinium conductrix TaxID=554055 RepID=A0A2P6VGC6_9CHLO|nr:GNAT family [Micractinium conductrix]|eukprot:PSC73127.1 GNAT family [Micractinium conductrix]